MSLKTGQWTSRLPHSRPILQADILSSEKWPSIIEPLLDRLNHVRANIKSESQSSHSSQIVYNEFPLPRPYSSNTRPLRPSSPSQAQANPSADPAQPAPAPSTPLRNLPPVPPFPGSSASRIPDSQPAPSDSPVSDLPTPLVQLLNSITRILRHSFSNRPPHTIQRLSELLLQPTRYYKSLPAWLRALDRVVSVSSTADIFPLDNTPAVVNGVNGDGGGGILWNNAATSDTRNGTGYDANGLGSDESLGGALLTPIPWLTRESGSEPSVSDLSAMGGDTQEDGLGDPIELPSTAGMQGSSDPMVPEREDGAVTQGELIRMEQEAGVVPVGIAAESTRVEGGTEMDEEGEAMPHARGPDVVGTVDMGLVEGKEIELNISSPPGGECKKDVDVNDAQEVLSGSGNEATSADGSHRGSEDFVDIKKEDALEASAAKTGTTGTEDEMQVERKEKESEKEKDDDGDIVLVDVDGKTEDERDGKPGTSGENVGPDVAEASTLT